MKLKTLHKRFAEMAGWLKHTHNPTGQIKAVNELPHVLQRFLSFSGYVYGNRPVSAINWYDTQLKFSPGGKWTKIECKQINGIAEPVRLVYMKAKMLGLVSFEAIDSYNHGRGNMLIKALRFFTISDSKGIEMDQSELVTILAESILIPDYILQPYVQWTELDGTSVKGTITWNKTKASGVFYFDASGAFLRFETDDRYYVSQGRQQKRKWLTIAGPYTEQNGLRLPGEFHALWRLPEGDYTYFKGKIAGIDPTILDYDI